MGYEHLVEMLSKPARKKIIEIIVARHGPAETARLLGLSKPAITKYLKGRTHPSDETIKRIIEVIDDKARERIFRVMLEEIMEAVREYAGMLDDDEREKALEEIMEEINELRWRPPRNV